VATLVLTIARIASNLSQVTYPSWVLGFNVNHSFGVLRRIFTLTPSAVHLAATASYHRHRRHRRPGSQ
jgi:hypothetical protein